MVISGENNLKDTKPGKESKKLHIYNEDITSDTFGKIIYSYSPDAVWFFSGYIDGGDGLVNEYKKLESLMDYCVVNEIPKLIVVSSADSLTYRISRQNDGTEKKVYDLDKAFYCSQLEELIRFTSDKKQLKTILLRVPYIYTDKNFDNYLGSLFEKISKGSSLIFPYREEYPIDFISARNLAELMISVTEETLDTRDEYTVYSGYDHSIGELVDSLKACRPNLTLSIAYEDKIGYDLISDRKEQAEKVRKNYGFVATDDVILNIKDLYQSFTDASVVKTGWRDVLKELLISYSDKAFKISEMLILFAIVQFLLRYTADSVYFRYVDLRLFFVVIMGITHGMGVGLLAGLLECISLVRAYLQSGVTGTMLFYNMDYWLPFAIYLMTGTITGYIMNTKNQRLKFAQEEVETLQDKYMFLNNVYMSVIDNKEEYKKQILGYQDSFGKIFEAVEKLNSSTPADIFMNGISTLESILENRSIAIYTLDEYQKYGRLAACSQGLITKLSKSLRIDRYQVVYDTILSQETWKNTEFKEDLPVYAYAMLRDGKVRLMICIYDAEPDQLGLYYMNLFTILCNLIRVAFMRALDYQKAIEDDKYYDGTDILLPQYLEIELESQRKMSEAGIASYLYIRIDTEDSIQTGVKLQNMIRQSDFIGRGTDGKCYLLLTQTNKDIFKNIGERLKRNDIEYTIVEGM